MRLASRVSPRISRARKERGNRTLWIILVLMNIAPSLCANSAQAQSQMPRSYVSGSGKDNVSCTAQSPCRTFQAALAQTVTGGEIFALDSSNYGSVTINKAVTITSEKAAGILVGAGVSGVIINAGANDVITLRGLDIDGAGAGMNGIQFSSGAGLNVQNCVIRGFANGISFTPTDSSALAVAYTFIANNTTGIGLQTSAAGTGVLNDVQLFANGTGMFVLGKSTGPAVVAVGNSVIANNSTVGILSNGYSTVSITNSTLANNVVGLEAQNAGALLQISGSTVAGTGTG
jgi:hypothetical protein